ncbi:MAG TPA: pyridoxamine 5'-phosphate oxidase family protein [Candidatus Bathyarchaeia archaeon]|nr:pyridoxamine 5'-phosphate oxidase family protein [Candidatus Bathyarchaeia archaeon]
MYHEGMRELQDHFDSRRIADRLNQVTVHDVFSETDRSFVEQSSFFFLATADAGGVPDCSYKGGLPGFVRVVDDRTLAFPHYDGNGMFRSLGNITVNHHVAMLFIDFEEPDRLRINGTATIHYDDPLTTTFPGSQLIVRVRAESIFQNCPRYIHKMKLINHSVYVPRPEHTPPTPEWKKMSEFRDALPRSRPKD